jgi:hypothetical protein
MFDEAKHMARQIVPQDGHERFGENDNQEERHGMGLRFRC